VDSRSARGAQRTPGSSVFSPQVRLAAGSSRRGHAGQDRGRLPCRPARPPAVL